MCIFWSVGCVSGRAHASTYVVHARVSEQAAERKWRKCVVFLCGVCQQVFRTSDEHELCFLFVTCVNPHQPRLGLRFNTSVSGCLLGVRFLAVDGSFSTLSAPCFQPLQLSTTKHTSSLILAVNCQPPE